MTRFCTARLGWLLAALAGPLSASAAPSSDPVADPQGTRAPPAAPPAAIDWVERPDGLKTADLVVGTGAPAARGARIVVEYTGWVADSGVMFDSSFVRSDPFVFTLGAGQVIRGWDKGVKDMRVGGTRMLYIPSYLAYSSAAQGEIPAYADLVFQVQLLDVQTRP